MNTLRKKDRLIVVFLTCLLFSFNQKANSVEKPKTTNQPPVVRIITPKNGEIFKVGERVVFEGKATDLEDGEVSGKNLIWTSDLNGRIGEGSYFSYDKLLAGIHIIVLTVIDSGNSQNKHSIFITVGTPKITEPVGEVEKPGPEKSKLEPEIEKIKVEKQTVPSIVFLFVPPFGSLENLQGMVLNADPNDFAVAVYIMVDGVWWSKPVIKINKDREWVCDITTAENDELAIKIAAYLIPADYKPPTASGDFWILKEIEKKSIAKTEVTRKITTPSEVLKLKKNSEAKKPQPKEGPEEKPLIKEEEMKRFFPLAVGNSWKYKRTVYKSEEVFYSTEQTIVKSESDSPLEGTTYLTVGRAIGELPQNSIEAYTIFNFTLAGRPEGALWNVKIEGNNPRDGRYSSFTNKEDPNIRWHYVEKGVWEIMDGEYLGADTENRNWLVLLTPNVIISTSSKDGEPSLRAMGAVLTKEIITTPAGVFSNCLKNCTMIKGKNLAGVLLKNEVAQFSDEEDIFGKDSFGKFLKISYYAREVGLIKEIQYNFKGEITYELELIEYNVK